MTFFKIIKDEEVIDIGCVFLKWNDARKKMYICDVNEAQFVQTFDETKIYKASWLNPAPKKAGKYETVTVEVIDETEFDELKELLSEGQPIFIDEPVIEVQHHEEVEIPEEKPMTIAEMRQLILEQQKQIETLLKKFQT